MPLDTKNRKEVMSNTLRYMIHGSLNDAQGVSGCADCLMMSTVYPEVFSVYMSKIRIRKRGGGMNLIRLIPCVSGGFFYILNDGATEKDINKLHSLTDSKYRTFPLDELVKCLKLDDIQLRIYVFRASIVLSEEGRSNITAAGKHQCIISRERVCIKDSRGTDSHMPENSRIVGNSPVSADNGNPELMGIRIKR